MQLCLGFVYRELDAITALTSMAASDQLVTSSRAKTTQNVAWLVDTCQRVSISSEEFSSELRKLVRPAKYAKHMQVIFRECGKTADLKIFGA